MKIVTIKDFPMPTGHSELMSEPSYDLTVEMTQEEYNHICYLLENDARETTKIMETYRKVQEAKIR